MINKEYGNHWQPTNNNFIGRNKTVLTRALVTRQHSFTRWISTVVFAQRRQRSDLVTVVVNGVAFGVCSFGVKSPLGFKPLAFLRSTSLEFLLILIEQFRIEYLKTKLRVITLTNHIDVNNITNQSKLEGARGSQSLICFNLNSDWLRKWREFSITNHIA